MFCTNEFDFNLILHTNVAEVSIWKIYGFHCNNVNTLFYCIWCLFAKYLSTMCRFVLLCVPNDFTSINALILEHIIQLKSRMILDT